MNYLIEKLILSNVIKDYQSLMFREDLSNAKYKFSFLIDEYANAEQIKNELIEDIFKLTLSIRKHTGGVKHISEKDKEPVDVKADILEEIYGGNKYTLYILFPSRMAKYKPKKNLLGFYIPIPGRPVCMNINLYQSQIVNIISTTFSKKQIADISVKKIMEEAELYGLDNINSFDFYVFEDNVENQKRYHIIVVYNFKDDGEQIYKDRLENKKIMKNYRK